MEENLNLQSELIENNKLELSATSLNYLNQTRKWGFFFSILAIVSVVLMLLLALVMFVAMSGIDELIDYPSEVLGIIYIVIGVLYIFPTIYLYKFSTEMKSALLTKNSDILEKSLKNQKSLFKFMGIMTIVILSIYLLSAIVLVLVS